MLRYEWKKLLHNRFFIGFFVVLFLLNAALSFMEARDTEKLNPASKYSEGKIQALDDYTADPEAWEAEYARLKEAFRQAHAEAETEVETTPSGGVTTHYNIEKTEDVLKYYDYRDAERVINRLEESVKDIKRIVRVARVELDNLTANGVKPTDYAYEYQEDLIEIYSVNALIPIRGEYLRGWDHYFTYSSGNVLLVMLLLVLVPGICLEEHASGMYPILHATKRGRVHTILCKLAVMLGAIVACVLLFTGTTLAIYGKIHGFSSLGNFLQAFDFFKSCPEIVTVGDYLFNTVLTKILVLFGMGAIILLLSAVFRKYALTFVTSLGIVGVNLVLHFVVSFDMASFAGAIKLLGCFTVMDTSIAYRRYHALNLFNNAVPYIPASLVLYGLIALVGCALSVLFFCRTQGNTRAQRERKFSIKRLVRLPNAAIPLPGRGLVGAEVHKNLLSNGFLLVIVAVLFVKCFMAGGNWVYTESFTDSVYREYTVRLEGELTEEKRAYIEGERARIDDAIARYDSVVQDNMAGLITAEAYLAFMDEYAYASQRKDHFTRIEAQAAHIQTLAEEGKAAHFVYDTGWRAVFSQEFDWLLYGVTLLLFAAVFADEFRGGTPPVLRATKRGRGRVFLTKYLTALGTATVVFAAFTVIDLVGAIRAYDLPAMSAPLASIGSFAALPEMALWQYYLLMTAVKYVGILALTVILLGVSLLTKKTLSTLSVVAVITILPYLLRRLGLDVAWYADYTYLLDGNRYLVMAARNSKYALFFTGAVVLTTLVVTGISKFVWVDRGIRRKGK